MGRKRKKMFLRKKREAQTAPEPVVAHRPELGLLIPVAPLVEPAEPDAPLWTSRRRADRHRTGHYTVSASSCGNPAMCRKCSLSDSSGSSTPTPASLATYSAIASMSTCRGGEKESRGNRVMSAPFSRISRGMP